MKAAIPIRQAVKPVRIGLAPEIAPAAKAARQTGGVIAEMQPK